MDDDDAKEIKYSQHIEINKIILIMFVGAIYTVNDRNHFCL